MKKPDETTSNLEHKIVNAILGKNNPPANVQSINIEDKIELERREAYIDGNTRNLLRTLLQKGSKAEITPIYVPGSGFVYKVTNQNSDNNQTETLSREFLENIARLDILNKSFHDSAASCPNCKSTIITIHNPCPRCKSHNVSKTSLTEHIPCGYIDQRSKYIDNQCPQCGLKLVEGQYRNMGRWYVCSECSDKFENPELELICRRCNTHFSLKEAQQLEIPKFSLNPARKKEIRQNVASLEDIRTVLNDLGFTTEIPGTVLGQKSGMQHHFSLIGKKQIADDQIVIALDHAVSDSEVQASPVILYIYKTSEIKVDIPIFIAIPSLNDVAKKIAQGHNIILIEGSTEESDTLDAIKTEIEARIEQKIKQKKTEEKTDEKQKKSIFSKFGRKN